MNSKARLRHHAYDLRNAQRNKQQISEIICSKVISEFAYQQAQTVMLYLHCRSEVKTQWLISDALNQRKKIVIPYCTVGAQGQNILGLWHLEDLSELVEGTWGILEPPQSRWLENNKVVDPLDLDLIVVPGVAFSPNGARLGNGAGYYDRLLGSIKPETTLLAICFESQLLPVIPIESHDVFMDLVITEDSVYRSKGRQQND